MHLIRLYMDGHGCGTYLACCSFDRRDGSTNMQRTIRTDLFPMHMPALQDNRNEPLTHIPDLDGIIVKHQPRDSPKP